jgi:hypothetical protein
MRPLVARLGSAILAALLMLAIAGSIANAGDPPTSGTPSVPTDPGYEGP